MKTDLVSLLQDAQAEVETSPLYKRFIDGTPLSNDIAVWMAEFTNKRINGRCQDCGERTPWKVNHPAGPLCIKCHRDRVIAEIGSGTQSLSETSGSNAQERERKDQNLQIRPSLPSADIRLVGSYRPQHDEDCEAVSGDKISEARKV